MKEAQKRIQVYGRNELISKRARIAEVMIKLSGMIPGLSKQHVRDGLQCEKITVSRLECSSVTGLNGELKMMNLPVQELVPGDMIFLQKVIQYQQMYVSFMRMIY